MASEPEEKKSNQTIEMDNHSHEEHETESMEGTEAKALKKIEVDAQNSLVPYFNSVVNNDERRW